MKKKKLTDEEHLAISNQFFDTLPPELISKPVINFSKLPTREEKGVFITKQTIKDLEADLRLLQSKSTISKKDIAEMREKKNEIEVLRSFLFRHSDFS